MQRRAKVEDRQIKNSSNLKIRRFGWNRKFNARQIFPLYGTMWLSVKATDKLLNVTCSNFVSTQETEKWYFCVPYRGQGHSVSYMCLFGQGSLSWLRLYISFCVPEWVSPQVRCRSLTGSVTSTRFPESLQFSGQNETPEVTWMQNSNRNLG